MLTIKTQEDQMTIRTRKSLNAFRGYRRAGEKLHPKSWPSQLMHVNLGAVGPFPGPCFCGVVRVEVLRCGAVSQKG